MIFVDLFFRNNVNVEGATHRQVVELIKSCGDTLTLTVISVSEDEAERLEPSGDLPFPDELGHQGRKQVTL